MPMSTTESDATHPWPYPSDDASSLSRLEKRLPTLLSVIAGMVDLIGFLTLGNIFTAHITGNLVVLAAVLVRGGPLNLAQALAIPVFSLVTNPSASPHGLMAGIAVMIAVSAMACQYALLRLAVPGALSTAVMTGNLTNTVLSLLDTLSPTQPLMEGASERLKRSLHLLFGFLVGCVVAAAAVSLLGDWAWSFPVALAGVAVAVR